MASTTVARYPTFRPTVAAGASFRGSVGRGGFQISRRRGGAIARSRDPGGWSFGGPLIGWKLHRAADWPAVVDQEQALGGPKDRKLHRARLCHRSSQAAPRCCDGRLEGVAGLIEEKRLGLISRQPRVLRLIRASRSLTSPGALVTWNQSRPIGFVCFAMSSSTPRDGRARWDC